MTDMRMLEVLQEIRRFVLHEIHGEKVFELCHMLDRAIDLDLLLFEERLGLKPVPNFEESTSPAIEG